HGAKLGYDVNDALDRRSALLKQISEIVPVSGYTRANNDMVLTTTTGATLFETRPRQIDFTEANAFSAATDGEPVFIDFVKFAVAGSGSGEASGKLDALLKMRDVILPGMQRQMDEFAHGLIASFAEQDAAATLAPLQGLFAWSGGPAFASEGVLIDGLAAEIFVNPLYDPQQGGLLTRLRDGGANGALYNANPSGAAAYAERITGLLTSLDSGRPFAPSAGLSSQASLPEFGRQIGSVFAQTRSDASRNTGLAETRHARFAEQLSNETGVNIDNEMILLGELEHSYEASARLIKVADQMLQELLAAVG
ncbi:MAG: flagellar basal body rod C-terminal domain-containing protein, partial [Rhizobiaceae bacterium]